MRFDGGCYRKVSYMTVKNDVKSRIDRKKKRWCLNEMTKLFVICKELIFRPSFLSKNKRLLFENIRHLF